MKQSLFVSLFVCLGVTVLATEALAVHKVTPRVIDREVSQRDLFTETVTIENYASHKITVFPTVNGISLDAGGDIQEFFEPSAIEDKTTAITSWIEVSRAGLELAPGEIVELPVSFRVHQDAPAGNYQAFVGFGRGSNRLEAESNVAQGRAPGVIVALAVDQNQTEFLKLNRFIVDKFVTSNDNQAISYTLKNPGEAGVVPTGEIIFYNGRGEEVAAVPVNPDSITLNTKEDLTLTAVAPTEGMLGKYKAFLSIDYGTEQVASVYDTAFFYVVPWQQILIAFAILLTLTILITLYFNRRYNTDDDELEADFLPVHVYEGTSDEVDHDINLKS